MSLQLKLNLIITFLLICLLGVSAVSITESARQDVRAEVESTSNLVLHLLDAEIIHYTSDFGWLNRGAEGQSSIFRLQELGNIRHLKIDFFDVNRKLRETNRHAGSSEQIESPPHWFVKAMDLSSLSGAEKRKNIVLNGRYLGELVITPDPSYEMAEIWEDTKSLLEMLAVFFVLLNIFAFVAVRHTFKPVKQIVIGLKKLEDGQFEERLPTFKQIELRDIGLKFNAMADKLQQSVQNSHRLTQQIINLQEDERKRLAQDIHDEIGQYLTAIHVDASAIVNSKKLSLAKESARAISSVTRQMMLTIHELLQRLRPRVLDELGLSLALAELIHHWRQRNRSVSLVHSVSNQLGEVDETVAVTAYRIMQECLTNVSKHANPKRLHITVTHDDKNILMEIIDDGKGFDIGQMTEGFGLAGMRERVYGLTGQMHIEASPVSGTKISITLPKKVNKESLEGGLK